MRGTVVMATYNEAASIRPVLAEIDEAATTLRRGGVELSVLLVDDVSPDGTGEIAAAEAQRFGLDLDVIDGPSRSPGSALLEAFRHILATGEAEFIVTLDPDGRHDARQITDLVRMFIARRSGLTIGSRWVRGGSSPGTGAPRAVASRAASLLVRRATGVRRIRDATTSFWVVDLDVARTVLEDGLAIEGYGFYPAFVALAEAYGYSVDEVPIVYRPRYSGVATLSLRDVADFQRSLRPVRQRAQEVRSKMRADQATWASRSGRMRGQPAVAGSSFGADVELERLAAAERFFGWIADEIEPHLGRRILEVGAGIGTVSLLLADRHPDAEIVALEPAANLFEDLRARTAGRAQIVARQLTSA
ncbi:MAG: glycosyltransferase, partial [Actinomycetes bacterium]